MISVNIYYHIPKFALLYILNILYKIM